MHTFFLPLWSTKKLWESDPYGKSTVQLKKKHLKGTFKREGVVKFWHQVPHSVLLQDGQKLEGARKILRSFAISFGLRGCFLHQQKKEKRNHQFFFFPPRQGCSFSSGLNSVRPPFFTTLVSQLYCYFHEEEKENVNAFSPPSLWRCPITILQKRERSQGKKMFFWPCH